MGGLDLLEGGGFRAPMQLFEKQGDRSVGSRSREGGKGEAEGKGGSVRARPNAQPSVRVTASAILMQQGSCVHGGNQK